MINLMKKASLEDTPVQVFQTDHYDKQKTRHGQLAGRIREAEQPADTSEINPVVMFDLQCADN
tara:strand:- start:230 stop:418 length:189 start_codon:yes stop_codon:yes gene_type:complete